MGGILPFKSSAYCSTIFLSFKAWKPGKHSDTNAATIAIETKWPTAHVPGHLPRGNLTCDPAPIIPPIPILKSSECSGPQKGRRQKTSKIVKSVKIIFDTFRHFSRRAKNVQKSSKSVKNIFDTFRQFSRGTSFPAPFLGAPKNAVGTGQV